MEIKAIRTEEDYRVALKEIEELFDAEPNAPDGDRLEALVTLVEAYEAQHYAIPLPDPIAAIEYYLESRGLSPDDLEPYIGSGDCVLEVLSRRRRLTRQMIVNLEQGLGIPAEVLSQEYHMSVVAHAALYAGWKNERPVDNEVLSLLEPGLETGEAAEDLTSKNQILETTPGWTVRVDERRTGYAWDMTTSAGLDLPVVYVLAGASGDHPPTGPSPERISS